MQPNYYMMWKTLKEELPNLVVDGNMIHLEDMERAIDEIESDESR